MVDARFQELEERLASHPEWLLVRENGTAFPIRRSEIELTAENDRALLSFLEDSGCKVARVHSVSFENEEAVVEISAMFGRDAETVRFVPRVPASELSRNIEAARLELANETAAMIANGGGASLVRVGLNGSNGRLAEIVYEEGRQRTLLLSDVTGTKSPEALLCAAVSRLNEMQRRQRKAPAEVRIAAERRKASALQKLHAMLDARSRSRIRIAEIARGAEEPHIKDRRSLTLSDLWRAKPAKLNIPAAFEISDTARRIAALSPENTDVVFSRQGETVRFNGLAFARIRTMFGREKAWFGVEKPFESLTEDNRAELAKLVQRLERHRSSGSAFNRHQLYRAAPEAWMETILKKNVAQLDANLILSPIFNQFRASADKIDLLAIRRDGRLVIIELKTSPDREMPFQAADYWRKIELQRRRGELQKARLFGNIEILDRPTLIYAAAPALCFHRDFEIYAGMLAREVEIWRFDLDRNWRSGIRVLRRYGPQKNL